MNDQGIEPQLVPRPLGIRLAHWLNAVVLTVMLWSGFSLFATERAYASLVHRIPDAVWSALRLSGHRDGARAWHYAIAILFVVNGIAYVIAAVRSGTWYVGAQKFAYAAVLVGAAAMAVTGAAMWFHPQLLWLQNALGGKRLVENVHILIACSLLIFIVAHVVQVMRAGAATFFTMLVGRVALTRRSAALTGAAMLAICIVFAAGIQTSKPAGVPSYLRWILPPDDKHVPKLKKRKRLVYESAVRVTSEASVTWLRRESSEGAR